MVLTTCGNCGKKFNVRPSFLKNGRGKFCSFNCSIKGRTPKPPHLFGESNPNWKGGITLDAYDYYKIASKRYPERHAAREATKYALRVGKLLRQPCEICGAKKAQAHHDDYSQPLKVRWLCSRHHADFHHGKLDQ